MTDRNEEFGRQLGLGLELGRKGDCSPLGRWVHPQDNVAHPNGPLRLDQKKSRKSLLSRLATYGITYFEMHVAEARVTYNHLDDSYDEEFLRIEGLKWFPWVGASYRMESKKIIILGESVYNWKPGCTVTYEAIEDHLNLRKLHFNHALSFGRKSKYVRNIERAIFNKREPTDKEKESLWSRVVYHNLVLKCMKTKKQRPTYQDYYNGWVVLDRLIQVLDSSNVLVYGLEKSKINALHEYAESKGAELKFLKGGGKVGRSRPKIGCYSKDGKVIKILFVRHPSSFFSWKKWSPIIQEHLFE